MFFDLTQSYYELDAKILDLGNQSITYPPYNHLLMKAVKLGKVHHSLDEFLNIVQDRSKTLRAYAN